MGITYYFHFTKKDVIMSIIAILSSIGDKKIVDEMSDHISRSIIDAVNIYSGEKIILTSDSTGLDFLTYYVSLNELQKEELRIIIDEAYLKGKHITEELAESINLLHDKTTSSRQWMVVLMALTLMIVEGSFCYIVILISLVANKLPPMEWFAVLIAPIFILVALNMGLTNSNLRELINLINERVKKKKSS